jgi:hypothetical protein
MQPGNSAQLLTGLLMSAQVRFLVEAQKGVALKVHPGSRLHASDVFISAQTSCVAGRHVPFDLVPPTEVVPPLAVEPPELVVPP